MKQNKAAKVDWGFIGKASITKSRTSYLILVAVENCWSFLVKGSDKVWEGSER